jgi:choline dehydrogenase-like flavoprotein
MSDSFEAVVVGSGFGGTILALSLANKYEADNSKNNTNKRVCVLERGQWWLSHETTFTPKSSRSTTSNMREYLEDNNKPYHFWAHPDNVTGILELLSTDRSISKTGLYDYKVLGNVHSIQASGVGGGSLIYSNVTIVPPRNVYDNWPTQFEGKSVEDYFGVVRRFLVVNKISTNAGLSTNLLEKTKAFQEAGQALIDEGNIDIVNVKNENSRLVGDFDLDLSITNIPAGLFNGSTPPAEGEIKRLLDKQVGVCQRQGRCVLGCIPNARHTFGNYLFEFINCRTSADPCPLEVRELCEVFDIEFDETAPYKYKVKYFKYDPQTEKRVQKYMLAKSLIIAAGSLGSTELLLKCNSRGSLHLSKLLGKKFFTNGDLFGFTAFEHRKIDVTRGPINTSRVSFKTKDTNFAYTIEDTTLSKIVAPAVATLFDLYAHGDKKADLNILKDSITDVSLLLKYGVLSLFLEGISTTSLIRLFTTLWNDHSVRSMLLDILKTGTSSDETTRKFVESILSWSITDHSNPYASPEERISGYYAFSGMGRGEEAGIIRLKPDWKNMEARDDPGEKIYVEWSAAENNLALKNTVEGMKKLARKMDVDGKGIVYTPFWDFNKPEESTAVILHPLGGCNMGANADESVVNSYGQVFWNDGSADKAKVYPDLFVVDGSILPEPPGVNPTMLIAAVAFRTAEKIVGAEYLPS